jgi:2-polyprenyl-3-methyl-5-hydroxy-6-metoxy-1,4-benzoquinol methylase
MSQIEPPECLRRRFELACTEVSVGGRRYELLRPRSVEDLISEDDFAVDERIPYWAQCWPSSHALGERLAREQGRRRRLLELGCGIGLVSLAAAQAGFNVLATDYYADALEFTAANAQRHGLRRVDTRLVDWRKLPADLGTFDVVAASDVLYEPPHSAWIAAALASTLSPTGLGLLSDPGRRTAQPLLDACAAVGLIATCTARVPTEDVDADVQPIVSIFEIRRAG